jgi:RNA polymerase sigma-70 factor, ECF subfamily
MFPILRWTDEDIMALGYDYAPREKVSVSRGIDTPVRNVMLAAIPGLRVFAISLCRNPDRADDLVQETLTLALAKMNSFVPGTNMLAWLCTILHNQFRSEYRKRRREMEDVAGNYTERLQCLPNQEGHIKLSEFHAVLAKLPTDQSEALVLVGALGFSYEEAASICGVPIGTAKSRVNRARRCLAKWLSTDRPDDFGPDWTMRAVFAGSDQMWGS